MAKQHFITGTSSGIGYALANQLLSEGHFVTGLSRRNSISHSNFQFHPIDLSNQNEVHKVKFEFLTAMDEYVLINNAGIIGDIKRVGELSLEHYQSVFAVNVIALCSLTEIFIRQLKVKKVLGKIINISSGAAAHSIPSWAAYCASKAAVDHFSQVVAEELKEQQSNSIKIYSVYPGIIDTPMQEHIRSSDISDFSSKIRFVEYKQRGDLAAPHLVASKILSIFKDDADLPQQTVVQLKDYQS